MKDLFDIVDNTVEYVEEKTKKDVTIFTYLTDIMSGKKGDVPIKDPSMSKFNTFMILRFLSLDEGYLPFINVINGFQDNLTKEEAYKMLLVTIPRTKKFLKYPKKTSENVDDDSVSMVAKYFICPKIEVEEYIKLNLLNTSDVEKIIESFGGRE
jgi:uncharacterized protein YqfB (UPF0267 family)